MVAMPSTSTSSHTPLCCRTKVLAHPVSSSPAAQERRDVLTEVFVDQATLDTIGVAPGDWVSLVPTAVLLLPYLFGFFMVFLFSVAISSSYSWRIFVHCMMCESG